MEAAVVMGATGCAPKIISADAGVFQNGTLYANSSSDIDSVYAATLQAMDKLQLQVTDKMKDVFAAKVVAKSADGKIVTVKIKPKTFKITQYEIHVSPFGNEERSQKIFDWITSTLETPKGK
jgi:hypothetical protein